MISLRSVTKTVTNGATEVPILRDVDFDVAEGEMVAIVGASGSGKSTLMNVIGLLDRPSTGTYTIGGQVAHQLRESERTQLRSGTFGFVFQAFHLIEERSVRGNVDVGLVHSGVARRDRSALVDRALGEVGLSHRADFDAARLSGGEKQRVAIARAVAGSKRVLLCDEPTGNLDSAASNAIIDLLVDLNRSGLTVVVVTHDQTVAARCERIVEMRDGRVAPTAMSREESPFGPDS